MTHRVIDIHHHIFPASSAVHPWNIETDKAVMDRQGITRVLLSMPLVTDTATAHGYNLLLQQQVQAYPEQYAMMGALPYDDADAALREIEFVMDELKAPAFGLNTHNHEIYISDDSLNPVFEELNRRSAVIFLHPNHRRASRNQKMLFCGNDSVYEYPFDTTRAVVDFVLQDKVTRWPNIRWILPHAGGTIPFLAHRIFRLRAVGQYPAERGRDSPGFQILLLRSDPEQHGSELPVPEGFCRSGPLAFRHGLSALSGGPSGG